MSAILGIARGARRLRTASFIGLRVLAHTKCMVLEKWSALRRQSGILGYPLTDEIDSVAFDPRRFNEFEFGVICWTATTGAHEALAAIAEKWRQLGGSNAGLPITDETATVDGIGRFNDFTGSRSIYWSPDTGAFAVTGGIRDKWLSLGGAGDVLGS
jgi:uncharacterized protein with LGFP repeats